MARFDDALFTRELRARDRRDENDRGDHLQVTQEAHGYMLWAHIGNLFPLVLAHDGCDKDSLIQQAATMLPEDALLVAKHIRKAFSDPL